MMTMMVKQSPFAKALLRGRSKFLDHHAKGSYFEVCERDKGGHCKPKGQANEQTSEKPKKQSDEFKVRENADGTFEVVVLNKNDDGTIEEAEQSAPVKSRREAEADLAKLIKDEDESAAKYRTYDTMRAISEYGQNTYTFINGYMRNPKTFGNLRTKQESKNLAEAMLDGFDNPEVYNVTKQDTKLYRGINHDGMFKWFRRYGKKLKGKVIYDKAFLSTSRSEEIVQKGFGGYGDKAVIFRIKTPKGTKYLSGRGDEHESILNAKTKLLIDSIDDWGGGEIFVYCSVVPEKLAKHKSLLDDEIEITLSEPYEDPDAIDHHQVKPSPFVKSFVDHQVKAYCEPGQTKKQTRCTPVNHETQGSEAPSIKDDNQRVAGQITSGSNNLNPASVVVAEKYKDEQAWHDPIKEFMEANGLSLEDWKATNNLLYQHNISSGGQTEKDIVAMWNSGTPAGEALRLRANWNEWQVENTEHNRLDDEGVDWEAVRNNVKKKADTWKTSREYLRNGEFTQTADEYLKLLDACERGELLMYRKGPLDKQVISTTADPNGATSGSSRFKPDRVFTYQEMRDKGYRLITGARGMVGVTSSQEQEYIWIKPDVVNNEGTKSLEYETKDLKQHKLGCLMAVLPDAIKKQMVDWTLENVLPEHLGPDGVQFDPHVTVVYGFQESSQETIDQIKAVLNSRGPMQVQLLEMHYFDGTENKDGTPLIVEVESPQLRKLNADLMASFPIENKFPEYKPHITLCYTTDGKIAEFYERLEAPFTDQLITIEEFEWSGADGIKERIKLSFLPQFGIKSACLPGQTRKETDCTPKNSSIGDSSAPTVNESAESKPDTPDWWKAQKESRKSSEEFQLQHVATEARNREIYSLVAKGDLPDDLRKLVPAGLMAQHEEAVRKLKEAGPKKPKEWKVRSDAVINSTGHIANMIAAKLPPPPPVSPKNLPSLHGSDKQIKYAEDIWNGVMEDIAKVSAKMGPDHPKRDEFDTVVDEIKRRNKATWWIDHRNDSFKQMYEEAKAKILEDYERSKFSTVAQAFQQVAPPQVKPRADTLSRAVMGLDAFEKIAAAYGQDQLAGNKKISDLMGILTVTQANILAEKLGAKPRRLGYETRLWSKAEISEALKKRAAMENLGIESGGKSMLVGKFKNYVGLDVGDDVKIILDNGYTTIGVVKRVFLNGSVGVVESDGSYHVRSVNGNHGKVEKLNDNKALSWLDSGSGGALVPSPQQGSVVPVKRSKLSLLRKKYAKQRMLSRTGIKSMVLEAHSKGMFSTVRDAGRWIAEKWSRLEVRYGRRAALAMIVAMAATMPMPGNIAAVVGAAEAIRGLHGYVSGKKAEAPDPVKEDSKVERQPVEAPNAGDCGVGERADETGCAPVKSFRFQKTINYCVKSSPFYFTKGKGDPCKPGETAAKVRCIPASGKPGRSKKPNEPKSGYGFYSPNTEEGLDYKQALAKLSSKEQSKFKDASESILKDVGVKDFTLSNAVGDWSDGAENSLMMRVGMIDDPELIEVSACMIGKSANQKAVAAFVGDPDGPDSLWEIVVPETDMAKIRQALTELGINFRTIIPMGDQGHKIDVLDPGTILSANMELLGDRYDSDVTWYQGRLKFIGADTREAAQQEYDRRIAEAVPPGEAGNLSGSLHLRRGSEDTGKEGGVTKSPQVKPSPFSKSLVNYQTKDVSGQPPKNVRGQPCPPGYTPERDGCIATQPGQGQQQPGQQQQPTQQQDQAAQPFSPESKAKLDKIKKSGKDKVELPGIGEVDAVEIGEKPDVPGQFQAYIPGKGYVDVDLDALEQEQDKPKEKSFAPPPPGENIVEPPCCLSDHDPNEVDPETGVTRASRVGVPGFSVPPPPNEIPRLPNLTEIERKAEARFADAFLNDVDGVTQQYFDAVRTGKLGDAPNIFSTDDAKNLSPDYLLENGTDDEKKSAKGVYNVAVHQTANVIAKRAFLKHLDDVVAKLPEEQRMVLVTSGGCAAGKGHSLGNVETTKELTGKVGAVWDAAGEQNSVENPWIMAECKKRGIIPIYAFIHANPRETWENEKHGVVERATKVGRMVDAKLFADSYAIGAKNFNAFYQKHKDSGEAKFFIIDNSKGKPMLLNDMPKEALEINSDTLNVRASKVLKDRESSLRPSVVRGGSIGDRIWGMPADEGWGE